jgi:hypothetical protein
LRRDGHCVPRCDDRLHEEASRAGVKTDLRTNNCPLFRMCH